MPRTARLAPNEHIYHVFTRGNNRQAVFKVERDYEKYRAIIQKYKDKYKFRLYHYALMGNHIHLVLETTEKGGRLSEIMKGINLSYVLYYKDKYRHIGHFWQDRYKSIIISKDDYLLACGSYVELNPVRAKIVEDPKDYRWSSYNVYAYGKEDSIVDEHSIYEELSKSESERRKKYRQLVKGMIKERRALKDEMNRRVAYGSEDFIMEVAQKYKVEAVIKPKGRPRKGGKERK